jgi:hypothetical protein
VCRRPCDRAGPERQRSRKNERQVVDRLGVELELRLQIYLVIYLVVVARIAERPRVSSDGDNVDQRSGRVCKLGGLLRIVAR